MKSRLARLFIPIAAAGLIGCATTPAYDPSRLEREVLVPHSRDAIQFEVLANGDIVFVEFAGGVKRWDAKSRQVTTLGRVPTYAKGEVGLRGFAVWP